SSEHPAVLIGLTAPRKRTLLERCSFSLCLYVFELPTCAAGDSIKQRMLAAEQRTSGSSDLPNSSK
ncbi:MAG: hypothetical protein IJO88_04365, partial [Oscillospiraceae bacterium]|nr:hypothetical protein [Oscillospiraceae bacterium]